MCSIAYEPCNEQSFRIGPTQMPYTQIPNMGGGLYASPYQSPFGMLPQNGLYSSNGLSPLISSNGMIAPNGMLIGPNGLPQMVAGPAGMLNILNPNSAGKNEHCFDISIQDFNSVYVLQWLKCLVLLV